MGGTPRARRTGVGDAKLAFRALRVSLLVAFLVYLARSASLFYYIDDGDGSTSSSWRGLAKTSGPLFGGDDDAGMAQRRIVRRENVGEDVLGKGVGEEEGLLRQAEGSGGVAVHWRPIAGAPETVRTYRAAQSHSSFHRSE